MWELSSSSNLRHHPGSNCNSPVRLAHSESPLTCCLALPNKLFHFPSCHVPNACCAQICLEYGTLLVLRTHLVYLQQTVFGSNSAVIYSPRFGASCLISCNWFCKSSPELRLAQDFQDNQKQVECRYQSIYIFVFCQLYTWKGSLPIFACWSPTQFVAWLDTMRYAKACAPFYESGWVKICIHDQTATTYIKNTTSNILTCWKQRNVERATIKSSTSKWWENIMKIYEMEATQNWQSETRNPTELSHILPRSSSGLCLWELDQSSTDAPSPTQKKTCCACIQYFVTIIM